MSEDDKYFENGEAFNAREAFRPQVTIKPEAPIDNVISEIVGKPIKTNNPNLIKLVAKFKAKKGDSDDPDNFLTNEEFINELKETFK